jgi:putative tryptophan/tyrosine transport system substrate-binding protein
MRRRSFITLLGGAAVWPLAARAQQPALPVIGFLSSASPEPFAHLTAAFRQGLSEVGYVEGRNVAIEYRWAEGQYNRLPVFAADLVRQQVAVIVSLGGSVAAVAAKAATTTIPIVFNSGGDPVKFGLVASLNQPGGNVTGVSLLAAALGEKRLGLIHDLIPGAAVIAVMANPNNPNAEPEVSDVLAAARIIGKQVKVFQAGNERGIDATFASIIEQRIGVLATATDPFFNSRRDQIVALAARHALPTLYDVREFAAAGGLMSYGTSLTDAYRQVGVYTGRILKGAKPADLPVVQASKFELVINAETARMLGLDVPAALLARADEVIE